MNPDTQPQVSAPPWSGEARSLASLLLFAHLFALVVAVTTYTRPSELQVRLHDLFAPYLRNLHLTAYPVSYPFARYYLTHSLPTDVDFSCEVEFTNSDGAVEKVSIPMTGLQPLVRLRRYQAIANAAGTLADAEANEDFNSILPKAIAGSILKRRGATQGTVKLLAHYLPQLEDMGEIAAGRREPPVTVIYEAQVFTSGGNVELLKKSTTLEVAPVETRPAKPSGPKPAPTSPSAKGPLKP
jgi:hypothetical protein